MRTFVFGLREDAGKWRRQGQDEERGRSGPGHVTPTILSDFREMGEEKSQKEGFHGNSEIRSQILLTQGL